MVYSVLSGQGEYIDDRHCIWLLGLVNQMIGLVTSEEISDSTESAKIKHHFSML